MNDNIRITYPASEKVYVQGNIHKDIKVALRRVNLTPTVDLKKGERII